MFDQMLFAPLAWTIGMTELIWIAIIFVLLFGSARLPPSCATWDAASTSSRPGCKTNLQLAKSMRMMRIKAELPPGRERHDIA